MREFDLNIQRVLENWTLAHALREVIANALDEQALTDTRDPDISRDGSGALHVRDWGRGLRYDHLTQNENPEKLSNPDRVIGKFGVGLKDALATFHRNGVDITIRSRHGDIRIATHAKHGFDDVMTLHALIGDATDPDLEGTEVVLGGDALDDQVVTEARSFFLKYSSEQFIGISKFGNVLAAPKQRPSRIYVNGLRVAEEPNFLFSYNITSTTKELRTALNRERSNVGRSAYTDRIKAILLGCNDRAVINALVEDLEEFETGAQHDETAWTDVGLHACQQLNAMESVVFITASEAMDEPHLVGLAEDDGRRVVIVPDSFRWKLPTLRDTAGNPMQDLTQFHQEWNDSFSFQFVDPKDLLPNEQEVWRQLDPIVKAAGGLPKIVRDIRISETMRLTPGFYAEAAGLWESTSQQIIIKRTELATLPRFAGVLIHEIVHASSGAGDVTREFESALTEYLGKLAAQLLSR